MARYQKEGRESRQLNYGKICSAVLKAEDSKITFIGPKPVIYHLPVLRHAPAP